MKQSKNKRKNAFTLTEMLVVLGVMMLMMAMAVPAYNSIMKSQRETSARNLVKASLTRARAYALGNQKYAGIRFQFNPEGWESGRQYLVLIEKHPDPGGNTFIAVANIKPSILPQGMMVVGNDFDADGDGEEDEADFDENDDLMNICTFSIIFSPTGALATTNVAVARRNADATDSIFGMPVDVDADPPTTAAPVLYYDNYSEGDHDDSMPWCYTELSTNGFHCFEVERLKQANDDGEAAMLFGVVEGGNDILYPLLINTYTGTIIDDDI